MISEASIFRKYTAFKIDPPHDMLSVSFTNPNDVSWESGTYYGDASGGAHSEYNELRRCGCSVVKCTDAGSLLFGADFPLPGEIQTVPRGELYCIVYLITMMPEMAEVEYITDNLKVSDTYNGGPQAGMRSVNCDLYFQLFQMCIAKRIRLDVRWMPSHLKLTDPRPEGITDTDIISNGHADILAGRAADRAAVPMEVSNEYLVNYTLVQRIRKRLVAVLMALPHRNTENIVRPPRVCVRPPPIEELLANTQHTIRTFGDRHVCTKCLNGFKVQGPQIRHWLNTNCQRSRVHSLDRPNPLNRSDTFHIGNQSVNSSHTLRQHKGLIYCKRCGNIAAVKIHKLAELCGPPNTYGKRNLANIQNDKLPYGMDQWPSQRLGLSAPSRL